MGTVQYENGVAHEAIEAVDARLHAVDCKADLLHKPKAPLSTLSESERRDHLWKSNDLFWKQMREPEPDYIKLYEEETDKRFRKLIVAGDSDKILPKTVKHILGRAASSGPNEIADSSGGDENGEKSVKRIRGGPASSGCDVTREEVRRD